MPNWEEAVREHELRQQGILSTDNELYGLWLDHEHGGPAWWYCNYLAWFTPDVRIAHAQRLVLIEEFDFDLENVTVCRLGPYGEPLELEPE